MGPTEVAVDNNSKLRGVETDFDHVPIFGQFARNMAVSQYDQKVPAADAEVREKIAAKAKERVDRETTRADFGRRQAAATTKCSARWIRCSWIR